MSVKPLNALHGNCLGACKGGMVTSKYLPDFVLRAHTENLLEESKTRKSHEGIFSDDLVYRPYAYSRLFTQLGLSEDDFNEFINRVPKPNEKGKIDFSSVVELRKFTYPLIFKALKLAPDLFADNTIYSLSRDAARKKFYLAVTEFLRETQGRNLEFWNNSDKGFYNSAFGEFNMAWLSVMDIFESEELNPGYKNFKRIFPEKIEDLGVAIYTPKEAGPEGALHLDLCDHEKIPTKTIVVYRVGSSYTRHEAQDGEKLWGDINQSLEDLWKVDFMAGHIECIVSKKNKKGKEERSFCSDGKKLVPATEWKLDREIFAVYQAND